MRSLFFILIILVALASCKERYDPPLVDSKATFLVVEANLNPGPEATVVTLGRTMPINSNILRRDVNDALVSVEGRDNSKFQLFATGAGRYQSNLNLVVGSDYRLRIKTPDGKEYLSEYVQAKKTPPIDSVGWEYDDGDIQIHLSTGDKTQLSKYYRWEYEETWQINSVFFSSLVYEQPTNSVRQRIFPDENVFTCWKDENSTQLLLTNSTRLHEDLIYKFPIARIPSGSEKLSVRYSILVRQYVMDKQAYNFYELLKKNTEEIGSIFSPQPSELRGNISCISHPSEYVLGYVTSSTVETRRIFITIPTWNYQQYCPEFTVRNHPDSLRAAFGSGQLMPYTQTMFGFMASHGECVDCRTRGGSTVKPSFW
jgi:hypothetical protein